MADEKMKQAKKVYETMLSFLDRIGWHYDKTEEKLLIHSVGHGEDLPVEFIIAVHPNNPVISFYSNMPFKMSEDKRVDGAIAVSMANCDILDGSFDYDISDGRITFRLTSCYAGCQLSEETFEYILAVSTMTVDKYNDKFLMLDKGVITLEQFGAADD